MWGRLGWWICCLLLGAVSAGGQCIPQRLFAVFSAPAANFSAVTGFPVAVSVVVVDDCGAAVSNAAVVASFSNGDPALLLGNQGSGRYGGNWVPLNAASQVLITARATLPPLAQGSVTVQGQVTSSASGTPTIFSGGIVNSATFARGGGLAPGGIVSVFGRNMAKGLNFATSVPLPTTLGGATVSVGGVDAPLFFASDGQINAQLPFELLASASARPQVVVKNAAAVSAPEAITITIAQPGIFTLNQAGSGQGAILNPQGRLVDGSAPAAAGDVVVVYCTGLGAVSPAVKSGQLAPSFPLSVIVTPLNVAVGGRPAEVLFAGLSPGFVGLYQVNVRIPAGVSPGTAVELVIQQGGATSNKPTLAIR